MAWSTQALITVMYGGSIVFSFLSESFNEVHDSVHFICSVILHGSRKLMTRVDWLAVWDALKLYGEGGKLLDAIKAFYEDASAWVKISGETSEHSETKVTRPTSHTVPGQLFTALLWPSECLGLVF